MEDRSIENTVLFLLKTEDSRRSNNTSAPNTPNKRQPLLSPKFFLNFGGRGTKLTPAVYLHPLVSSLESHHFLMSLQCEYGSRDFHRNSGVQNILFDTLALLHSLEFGVKAMAWEFASKDIHGHGSKRRDTPTWSGHFCVLTSHVSQSSTFALWSMPSRSFSTQARAAIS